MKEAPQPIELPKPMVGRPFNEVLEVRDQHTERLMGNPNVTSIGTGISETNESRQFAIRLYLKQEPTEEQLGTMDTSIDGIPVIYEVVGDVQAGQEHGS